MSTPLGAGQCRDSGTNAALCIPVRVLAWFSRPPHSTALPPLRGNKYGLMIAIEEPQNEALMPILDAHSKISPLIV